jgi:hypothetical protein
MNNRDLLVADLCFRLPYGVLCKLSGYYGIWELIGITKDGSSILLTFISEETEELVEVYPSEVTPYLYPVESVGENFNYYAESMQDINGLISRGLAIDRTILDKD